MSLRLDGKVIIITGAAQGIGLATAELFGREGAKVVAVDIDEAALEKGRSKLPKGSLVFSSDVTQPESVDSFVAGAVAEYGKVDGLVHYAGVTQDALHWNMSLESFEQVVRVNLTGTFTVATAVSKVMREQQEGTIVLTASRVYLGNIGQANYAASKGAVVSLTRTLALELGRSNVRVNALAPGFIETRMTAQIPAKLHEKAIASTPLQRAGQPLDVARVALFLTSSDSSFMTGQVLFVDGGRTVGISPV
jgi:3-oxoacyl-[acyl-carrier protein] reductase